MATTPPPLSPSPSVEPDEARSFPPPSVQPTPKTPERERGSVNPVLGITPQSLGTAVRQRQEGDTDRVDKYNRGDYDDYVREDLKSRVFVDFDVLLKSVLHAPDDWKTRWGPTLEAVKADQEFAKLHEKYCKNCENGDLKEDRFYKPLEETTNAILAVLTRPPHFDAMSCGIPQYFRVNDPNKLRGGVFGKANLTPDLITLHKQCHPSAGEMLHWANPLHILEVKRSDNSISDGTGMPNLVVDGIDPSVTHAPAPYPLRYPPKNNPLTTSTPISGSTSKPRKRPAEESLPANQRRSKKSKTRSVLPLGDSSAQSNSTHEPEIQNWSGPAVQVCRYLLEMFSVPLLRSHATVSLVDRDRLQLYHANHTVILVSSAINFSKGDGLDKFIAYIIALRCLTPEQNGILDILDDGNINLAQNSNISTDNQAVQEGKRLRFPRNRSRGPVEIILTDVISRDPSTVGRSTVVLGATSDQQKDIELIVKASWPGSGRVSEIEFLEDAIERAKMTDGQWATKHLPKVICSKDVDFGPDSTLESVARLFGRGKVVGGEFEYERRTLRIIVQERLYPLKSLTNVKDVGQVFLDVGCIHRWLLDDPGILHRDLSFNNSMYRLVEEWNALKEKKEYKVYGVLTDYDLSSRQRDLEGDYIQTSQQRTGTPPYMAQELLKGNSGTHRYRHDVESLFWIMLLMCGRHSIDKRGTGKEAKTQVVIREGQLPYEDWYNERKYTTLSLQKKSFFTEMGTIELSPLFEDFRPWLLGLQSCFSQGFMAQLLSVNQEKWAGISTGGVGPTPVPFDEETLGGNISYSNIINSARSLKGKLAGLIVRYDPSITTIPALSPSAQADD